MIKGVNHLKKVLKQVIRIPLALFLAYILLSIGTRAYCEFEYRRAVNTPLAKSQEECIADFNANKEKFEAIKDYILTENKKLYLTHENYKEEVHDENVKSDLEFIFTQLEYSIVSQRDSGGVSFSYASTKLTRAGIIYSENLESGGFFQCWNLGENWHEYFIGYPYDENPLENYPPAFWWTICAILSIGLYLVLGLIPPFKKRKIPSGV